MMPARYTLHMLGSLSLGGADESQGRFATKRSALLLARLATSKDQRAGRDALAEMLWPDDYLDLTRPRLRQELRRLKSSAGGLGEHIRADRQWIEIEPGYLGTDLQAFDKAIASADGTEDPEHRASFLSEAVAQLKGQFLPGYQEPWVLGMRRDLNERSRLVWLALADAREALGDPEAALKATMDAVRHDPLDLEANACLIRRLAQGGQESQARQAYLQFDSMLSREFGRRAPASLRDFFGAQRCFVQPESEVAGLANEPATQPPWARPSPLFGRDDLVAELLELLSRPGACIVLVGTIGVGKTHVLREVAWQLARNVGIRVAVAEVPDHHGGGLLVVEDSPDAGALAATIAEAAGKGWRVLAESRVRLDSGGVIEVLVAPLTVPGPSAGPQEIFANPSIRLLTAQSPGLAQAQALRPAMALSDLSRKLDGLPIALKLFASRLTVQSPDKVLEMLEDGLREFAQCRTSGGDTVRASLSEMGAELPPDVHESFLSLAVLDGACADLGARLAPEDDDSEVWRVLERRSLVQVIDGPQGRRFSIPGPLAYAIRTIPSPAMLNRITANTYRALADWAYGQSRQTTGQRAEQAFDNVAGEMGNLRTALRWAIERDGELASRLVGAMWRTVVARGTPSIDGDLLRRGAEAGMDSDDRKLVGEGWTGTAVALAVSGRLALAEDAFLKACQTFSEAGHSVGLSWAEVNYAGFVLSKTSPSAAIEIVKRVAETTTDIGNRVIALSNLSDGLARLGEFDRAVQIGEQVFAERMSLPENPTSHAQAYCDLADVYQSVGRFEAARPLILEGVRRLRETGIQDMLALAILHLAEMSMEQHDVGDLLDEADALAQRIGSKLTLLELARLRLTWGSQRADLGVSRDSAVQMLELTQQLGSETELAKSLAVLASSLDRFNMPEYANAARHALGLAAEGPVNEAWKSLLSAESKHSSCALALLMAKEALV